MIDCNGVPHNFEPWECNCGLVEELVCSRCAISESRHDLTVAEAHRDRLKSFVKGIAEGDCEYGDGCPLFPAKALTHYHCDPCRAREALSDSVK